MRIKRQRLELDNKEWEASKKLLDMEHYLANAAVCMRIQPHLLRTRPASPPTSFIPCMLRSKGLKDATCMGWFGDDWDCLVGCPPKAMIT